MKYITWLSTLMIALSFLCTPISLVSMGADLGGFSMEELEEASKMIEDYVSSLSPEEQAAFNQQVDEWERMFQNMSDDELDEFLNAMFTDESSPENYQDSYTPAQNELPMVKIPELSAEEKEKINTLLKTVNDIIRDTNIMQVHINSSLELPGKIDKWISKKTISSKSDDATWETLRLDIENFVQMLYKMQNKDQTTGEYLYLKDILENQELMTALVELRNNLNRSISTMELSVNGMMTFSADSKKEIQAALSTYGTSLYGTDIPKMISDVFEKNSSKETKLKETEETIEQRAAENARRGKTPVSSSAAGTSDESSRSGYGSGYDSYGYDSSYPGYGSGSSYYDSSYYPSGYDSYGSDYGSDYGKSSGFGDSSGSSSSGSSSKSGSTIQPKEQEQTGPVAGPQVQKKPSLKTLVTNIKDGAQEIATLIEEKQLLSFDEYISKKENDAPVESEMAIAFVTLNKKCINLLSDLNGLSSLLKRENKDTQSYYSESLVVATGHAFETMKLFYTTLENTIKFKKEKGLSKISPEKQWAYFEADDKVLEQVKSGKDAEANAEEKVAKLKASVKDRVSVEKVFESINECINKLSSFKSLIVPQRSQAQTIQPKPTPENPAK